MDITKNGKLRICIITKGIPRIPPRPTVPVTIYIHTLAKELSCLGHEVDVICGPAPNRERLPYNIIEVGHFKLSNRNPSLRTLYELWYGLCLGLAVRRLHRQNQYDVIHFFEAPAPAFFALLLARYVLPPIIFSSGRPASGTQLTFGSKPSLVQFVSDLMHSYVFRRVTQLTTSSERLKEVVIECLRVDPAKITVAPFVAAEPDIFCPGADSSVLRQRLGLKPSSQVVLCLGEIAPYKNQISLVRAISNIVVRHPEAVFLLVGDIVKSYSEQVQKLIHSHELENHVVITGFVKEYSELPKYYNIADVYVLLSRAEGNLPKTTLEAMSCGKAIVVSDIPQNREGAIRGDEMLFVDPFDINAISSTINMLLDNPRVRQTLGDNARRTVAEYYAPRAVANRMSELYRRMIGVVKSAN